MSAVDATTYPPFPEVEGVRFALIPGFPGYCAGDDGTIWSCRHKGGHGCRDRPPFADKWRRMAACWQHEYLCAGVSVGGRVKPTKIAKLVLLAFVGPCPPGHEIRHFPNRDRTNNRLDNLRWGTKSENTHDQVKDGTHYFSRFKGVRPPWRAAHNPEVIHVQPG